MVNQRKKQTSPGYGESRIATLDETQKSKPTISKNTDKHTLCNIYERKLKEYYDIKQNFLYVMEAFTSRVDEFSACGESPPYNVTVPYWMAEAIAKGFRLYRTNLVSEGVRQDLTLDWCYRLTVDKMNEYDM